MKITEKNVVQQLLQQNEDALKFVVEKYGGTLKAVINRILYQYPQDAEECLYDCIMKIWQKVSLYNGKVTSFRNWTISVAKFTAIDRLRKIRCIEPAENIDDIQISSYQDITEDKLFDEFFKELISALSDEDKFIFTRLFWYGETIDEVAESTNRSKSVIYNRVSRGKKKIIHGLPDLFKGSDRYE